MKSIIHPILPFTLTFDPITHTYTDNESTIYTSVTTLVHHSFPPFDSLAAATRIAAKTNRLEMDIISEWNAKRDASASFGTFIHAFAESLITGQPLQSPTTEAERRSCAIVERAVTMLADSYDFISAEQMIFDPLFRIAGTIDLIARNKSTGNLAIIDWKTCEKITSDSYGFGLSPIKHVRDSKINHYALQLSIYALLYSDRDYSAYPTAGQVTNLALIHISPFFADPVWIPMPNMREDALAVMNTHKASQDALQQKGVG